jgi:CDP-glucose 4,6-dehydratase
MDLRGLFGGAYAGRRVLVTGHTGFKGSWLAYWLRAMGARVEGLALDPETAPSHWQLLALDEVGDHRIDLCNAPEVLERVVAIQPEIVFHLAAQPLVRRSYREPARTFEANVLGLVNLFEAVRACPSVRVLVNATTDKVYEEHPGGSGYRESDPLGGSDPYSTSKACAELVSACYRKCFFQAGGPDRRAQALRLATARAGNVIGGGDWAEDRLVPDLVRAATSQGTLRIRNPAATRPWQHVLEPLSGYLHLAQRLLADEDAAQAWNFGPDAEGEVTVGDLATRLQAYWPQLRIELDRQDHPREAPVLRLDCSKARAKLDWRPVWTLDASIERTADWYRVFQEQGRVSTAADLETFVGDARRLGVSWAR